VAEEKDVRWLRLLDAIEDGAAEDAAVRIVSSFPPVIVEADERELDIGAGDSVKRHDTSF